VDLLLSRSKLIAILTHFWTTVAMIVGHLNMSFCSIPDPDSGIMAGPLWFCRERINLALNAVKVSFKF